MSKEKFIILIKYSLILGAILGGLSVIPYLNILTTLMTVIFMSIIVIVYMQKNKQIGNLTIKGGAILGAIVGFIGLIGFLVIYLPLVTILGAIFEAIMPSNIYFSGPRALIGIWWLLIIMGGLISAIFNSFTLIAYVYIKDTLLMIDGKKPVNNQVNNITQGEFIPRNRG